MLKEFKEFALKGNVVDLAVAVVIGGAFGKIVTSLVSDIIMPIIALLTSGMDFTKMQVVVGDVTLTYGNFIQSVVDFLIVSASIFIVVKLISKTRRKEKTEKTVSEPPKPTEQQLLTEIRDLLKTNRG
jgi:large conductance mechanosensitive channel protein